jgi:uroporphyrin-III C-methyltransferase/precorrin-2 dehydrogenase/sirohydrochlorin ferrochelatase
MRSLPLFHRIDGRTVVVVGDGAPAEAKRRLVERAGGIVVGADDAEARLAFVASEGAEDTIAALKTRGLLVNVTDRPDLCDFTVPSVLERDPVLIAVGTSGASAGLAKQLRLRLEALLPPGLGALADALHAARGVIRDRWPGFDDRRRALDAALAESGPLDPLRAHGTDAVARWLDGAGDAAGAAHVVIELASDDPDDLTLRQARLLGTADVVLHEADVAPAILVRARADAVRIALPFAGPQPSGLVVELRRAR